MHEQAHSKNTRMGLWLFAFYTFVYASYVLVNAFAASWADWIVFAGLNLAVVWGFALIGLAFLLALVYGLLCQPDDEPQTESHRHAYRDERSEEVE